MTKDLERTNLEPKADESMVPVFSSSNHDAEMEASAIQGVLESSDIPSMVVGSHVLPNLEIQVQVPEHLLETARQVIREARQDGRRSADEAEAATG
jgi:Putative prokaryotic signal transducing protein